MTGGNGGSAAGEAHRVELQARVESSLKSLREFIDSPAEMTSAADLVAVEQQCARLCDALHAAVIAEKTQRALDTPAVGEQTRALARNAPKRLKHAAVRQVRVQFLRAEPVPLRTPYYRRRKGDISHREKGMFPALVLLGIHDHTSPAAAAQMARSACAMASLEEAAALLRDGAGLDVDIKTLRRITRRFGQRARAALPGSLRTLRFDGGGRSVVISVDGGRLRVRRNKAGSRTKKGRRRYHTDWREPHLLHIYVLDSEGRLDRSFSPLIDGTMGDSDALFALLRLYLPLLLDLHPSRILLIADGAPWIWARFTDMIEQQILPDSCQIVQLIDFYHAVEHLGAFAEVCTFWPSARRTRWRNNARHLLRAGKIETLIEDMQQLLARRPKSKAFNRAFRYFEKNRLRFSYAWARRLRLPNGSGPMESAIRRVINLRLKGPGIFWHEETAESMLMIRSYYKAHRWHELVKLSCAAPLEALI